LPSLVIDICGRFLLFLQLTAVLADFLNHKIPTKATTIAAIAADGFKAWRVENKKAKKVTSVMSESRTAVPNAMFLLLNSNPNYALSKCKQVLI
jgi:hypothetical protein